jgi:hypothetical protein
MIAVRDFLGISNRSKPANAKNGKGQPARDLVRRLEPLYWGISDLGASMVGRSAVGEPLVRTMYAKQTMGSSPVGAEGAGTEPSSERDCGA